MAKTSIPYALRRGEMTETGMPRILDAMGVRARELGANFDDDLPEAIHELRTLIKRLRAYLWFLRPAIGRGRVKRSTIALRDAAGTLSQARDLNIIGAALTNAAHPEASKKHLQSLVQVSEAFAEKETLQKKADPDSADALEKTAAVVARQINETLGVLKEDAQLPGTDDRVAKAFRAARKAHRRSREDDGLGLVHEWRKKTKRLFYLLQFTVRVSSSNTGDRLKKVDELQKYLGDFQDSVVAENHLRAKPPEIDVEHLKRAIHLLRKRRKSLLKDAYRCWREFENEY